ncbi:helix-turn-helix transcriptional regulator [Rhizobium leguminosarum]|uniref:helix-turn-helix transcriptional regulator n=1 Tax=Rhizobium leguminosarum TaxID=384 RepID=UPI0014423B9B|nr:helix-turn-helix transcriptional regulator [Rhizobium leguminosarum]MDH6273624.1 transcriptional regulator with XRE-family HTH domain [Rhizobium leguminosarum]NKK01026.1 helix-turn-helix domain-containing protein [Rhizobium leguminosarum bv. viciae]
MNPIRYIRTKVFKVSQAEFAEIAKVRQGSVSRWENGTSPSLEEMQNIRDAAKSRGIPWNDSWFFDVPVAAQ